jgi:hypothetical protein
MQDSHSRLYSRHRDTAFTTVSASLHVTPQPHLTVSSRLRHQHHRNFKNAASWDVTPRGGIVISDVSEERIAINKAERISELRTLAVTGN